MNIKSDNFSTCSWRQPRAMTLIEVMAALALLSTLLVMMLTAYSSHLSQWTAANDRLAAVTAADQLLTQWWQSETGVPRAGEGEVTSSDAGEPIIRHAGFRWRTFVQTNEAAQQVTSDVIRLEIRHTDSRNDDAPLVHVDVLLPQEVPAGTLPVDIR